MKVKLKLTDKEILDYAEIKNIRTIEDNDTLGPVLDIDPMYNCKWIPLPPSKEDTWACKTKGSVTVSIKECEHCTVRQKRDVIPLKKHVKGLIQKDMKALLKTLFEEPKEPEEEERPIFNSDEADMKDLSVGGWFGMAHFDVKRDVIEMLLQIRRHHGIYTRDILRELANGKSLNS